MIAERAYIVRPAIFAPSLLSLTAIAMCFRESLWCLASLPFIWLSSVCAQPNLNLVNGCLAYVSIIVGYGLMLVYTPLGYPILAGAILGLY